MRKFIALSLFSFTAGFGSTVNLTLATDSSPWSTLYTRVEVSNQRDARDAVNYSQTITTNGPERPGFLVIRWDGNAGYMNGGHAEILSGFTLNPYIPHSSDNYRAGNPPLTEVFCYTNMFTCDPGPGYWQETGTIPITLGAPLTLVATGFANNSLTPDGDVPSGGWLWSSFEFRFLEADHITNSQHPAVVSLVSEAPEPSTWGMLAAAGILGIIKVRKQWR